MRPENQKTQVNDYLGLNMADRTGLEPATSGVTGRHSNQLNYRSAAATFLLLFFSWVRLRTMFCSKVVGDDGIEPPTLCL